MSRPVPSGGPISTIVLNILNAANFFRVAARVDRKRFRSKVSQNANVALGEPGRFLGNQLTLKVVLPFSESAVDSCGIDVPSCEGRLPVWPL